MSDLTKELLATYYGIGAESSASRFVSIPECTTDLKSEYKRSIDEQTSTVTEEKDSSIKQESQEHFDDNENTDEKNENYPRSARALTHIVSVEDINRPTDTIDIDFGSNVILDIFHRPQSFQEKGNTPKTFLDVQEYGDTNDGSTTTADEGHTDNASDVSWSTQSKRTPTSLIHGRTPFSSGPKKEPIYNDTFVDMSDANLTALPTDILYKFSSLRMLYLYQNSLTELPAEVFTVLRNLEWLDVRKNQLKSLPTSVESHPCLETLLLDGNNIEKLPVELCTATKLNTLQVAWNPLIEPPENIVAQGSAAILNYLKNAWNELHPENLVESDRKEVQPKLSTIICYKAQRSSESKQKLGISKSTDSAARKVTAREKSKSYKPSNRYKNRNHFPPTGRYTNCRPCANTMLQLQTVCNSCAQKMAHEKLDSKPSKDAQVQTDDVQDKMMECEYRKRPFLELICDRESFDKSPTLDRNRILRLQGPSPRSLYIRKNIMCLKTYNVPFGRECRAKTFSENSKQLPSKGASHGVTVKRKEKKESSKSAGMENVFDIITIDAKRFKLRPTSLTNPDWILACLVNYLGLRDNAVKTI